MRAVFLVSVSTPCVNGVVSLWAGKVCFGTLKPRSLIGNRNSQNCGRPAFFYGDGWRDPAITLILVFLNV